MASCTWPCADVPSPITRGARPSRRVLSCSRDRLPPPPRCQDSRVFGLRHSTAGSPPPPGRIEFVAYGPSVHFRLLPTSPPGDAVTFSYKSENLDLEGTFTPRTPYTRHRTVAGHVAANFLAKSLSDYWVYDKFQTCRPISEHTPELSTPKTHGREKADTAGMVQNWVPVWQR
jgi:hypothetical protein